MPYLPWERAWQEALFGEAGFYRRPEGPAGHFRTSAHAAPTVLARAVARLARAAGCGAVLDLGAGRGELLSALARVADEGSALRLHGVDVVGRPLLLPPVVGWSRARRRDPLRRLRRRARRGVGGARHRALPGARDRAGRPARTSCSSTPPRAGSGSAARPATPTSRGAGAGGRWTASRRATGSRWAGRGTHGGRVTSGCSAGSAGACSSRSTTRTPAPPGRRVGTLSGYRSGRLVPPVPDGSCDVTAHVALDAVAAAGRTAGAAEGALVPQHAALRSLGVSGDEPGAEDILDPAGLGGFTWLLQRVPAAG